VEVKWLERKSTHEVDDLTFEEKCSDPHLVHANTLRLGKIELTSHSSRRRTLLTLPTPTHTEISLRPTELETLFRRRLRLVIYERCWTRCTSQSISRSTPSFCGEGVAFGWFGAILWSCQFCPVLGTVIAILPCKLRRLPCKLPRKLRKLPCKRGRLPCLGWKPSLLAGHRRCCRGMLTQSDIRVVLSCWRLLGSLDMISVTGLDGISKTFDDSRCQWPVVIEPCLGFACTGLAVDIAQVGLGAKI
jgi:hypothetical protein